MRCERGKICTIFVMNVRFQDPRVSFGVRMPPTKKIIA
jgi:hypothetical protein